MSRSLRKYTTAYKKKVDIETDTYLPKLSPKGLLFCTGCGAVYYRQRWSLNPPEEIRERMRSNGGVREVRCPGCRKIRDHYPSGKLVLRGGRPKERREILRLLRNEEQRAREKNPLERIMRIQTAGSGWRVETTTEKLAQRLGRSVRKARGGRVAYKWSHNNKFVRVHWSKEEETSR